MFNSTVSVSLSRRMRHAYRDAEVHSREQAELVTKGLASKTPTGWVDRVIARMRTVLRI